MPYLLREWSSITGRGGGYKMGRGAHEVLPLQKGGAGKLLAILNRLRPPQENGPR